MFVELIYDKRNFEGLTGARETITAELTKRVHRIFPDADVRVNPASCPDAANNFTCRTFNQIVVLITLTAHPYLPEAKPNTVFLYTIN